MKTLLRGSALALSALLPLSPALAGDEETVAEITVDAPLLLPSAGLMNDHMHEGGEFMIGLRFERARASGTNRAGTDAMSDAEIVAAGYRVRTESMEMDMAMLDLMYAPNDSLTLMVMPMYMWHRMTMVGIDPAAGMAGGYGAAMLPFGETHSHSAEGFSDTLVSASYRLARKPRFGAHATLGVWAPTGAVDKTNPDGTFVHYGMQPGSGTWDLEPSITLTGRAGPIGWGAQGGYRWRMEKANESGFRFGDVARATGWASYLLTGDLGATARLEYRHEGRIEGQYNGPHKLASPPDRQGNYGGDVVRAGIGLNWRLPIGTAGRPQLSSEFAVPVYQDLNGIQTPEKWRLALGLLQTF